MPDKLKLKIEKNTATIVEGADTMLGKLVAGCQGTIKLGARHGNREITTIKRADGKIIKRSKEAK